MVEDRQIRFTKMHGAGNDYIYIYCTGGEPDDVENLAVAMSDRHKGVGADGIILIMQSGVADFRMRMFNADGSEGKMCGNASRCIAKYVYDRGLITRKTITLETLSGIKELNVHTGVDGKVDRVTVDMGEPELEASRVPVRFSGKRMINAAVESSRGEVRLTAVSMGNPHGVVFVESQPSDSLVHCLGLELEIHDIWPDRANIEFAHVMGKGDIKMRVWERGSGETLACGTGACAAAVAAVLSGLCDRRVTVHLPGGDLEVAWDEATNHVMMTGPAETVMDGVYYRK